MVAEAVAYTEILTREPEPWRPLLRDVGYTPTRRHIISPERRAIQLRCGPSVVLLTEVFLGRPSSAQVWLAQHGEGVADVAFLVDDIHDSFAQAVDGGAVTIQLPAPAGPCHTRTGPAIIGGGPGTGGIRHTLFQAFTPVTEALSRDTAIVVGSGDLNNAALFYSRVFGLEQQPGAPTGPAGQIVLRGACVTLTLVAAHGDGAVPYGPDQQPWPVPDLLAVPRTGWN